MPAGLRGHMVGLGKTAALTAAITAAATAAGTVSAVPAEAAESGSQPGGTPNPTYFTGVPSVGTLVFTTGSQAHFCTASVVDSDSQDMVLTAAHCVYDSGYASNIAFVPGWHDGVSPYGEWPVSSITVPSGWKQSHDSSQDFAFLKVTPPSGQPLPVQAVTGGLQLGTDQGYSHQITAVGYNDTDSQPIQCATTTFESQPGQEEFYCNSFWNGTSGGPLITNFDPTDGSGTVVGEIGGYQQGGDHKWASYSDYFSGPVQQLFLQAEGQ